MEFDYVRRRCKSRSLQRLMPISGISQGLGIGGGACATSSGAPGGASTPLIIYTITNSGSAFYLRSSGTVDYTVDWGDGNSETSTSNTLLHTYSASGTYTINVSSDIAYRPYFNNSGATGEDQITSVELQDGFSLGTNLTSAWKGGQYITTFAASGATGTVENFSIAFSTLTALTSFPALAASSGTTFYQAWYNCNSLTSFPALDVSSGLSFAAAWSSCSSLTSFPALDASSGTTFQSAWESCTGLTSFPALDVSSGATFKYAWYGCNNLTSFPALDVSSGANFFGTWRNCSSLATFPADMFDTTGTVTGGGYGAGFFDAWKNCALTAQSIENILVSLVANGATSVTLTMSGGSNAAKSAWTTDAVTAYDTLVLPVASGGRGWTITFNA